MKVSRIVLSAAAIAAAFGCAANAGASELLYGFGASDSPNQLDGFASNSGLSLTLATATNPLGEPAMEVTTSAGGFKGALTSSVPGVLLNPAVDAISADVTVPADFTYAGGYADLGVTIFCANVPEGEYGVQYQVVGADEQNIDLTPGTTTTVTIPLTGPDPDTGTVESYGTLLTAGGLDGTGFIPTGFEFFFDENGANDVQIANVQADGVSVPEPASVFGCMFLGGLMLKRRVRKD
ncbi:MAG TPA: PEP-CTERM sorting domain-containing protein [Tepidisphaeraceae bacterium]|nr:PEP-CTERM sorting domain-containing protein [Tepidisphaeraceae bacterium]